MKIRKPVNPPIFSGDFENGLAIYEQAFVKWEREFSCGGCSANHLFGITCVRHHLQFDQPQSLARRGIARPTHEV